MRFLIRWLVNASGFFAAILLIPGITPSRSDPWDVIAIALVAGLANSILSPVLRFFTLPFVILTFGLWIFALNVLLFWFVGYLGREFGFGFTVDGFMPTLLGSIVVSIVSMVLGFVLSTPQRLR